MSKSKIKILDNTLISQIAAGEVVERPFSVVKELVENSIDAGATQVTVEIKNGGKELIRVVDNGSGMTEEDAKTALERHSTSKISKADDLFNINTLGFRGEAIPSIASISKFELLTKVDHGSNRSGTQVICDGGNINKINDFGCPEGTTITVKELFFNTPARLKFLKSQNTEISHVINIISKFILSNPKISFRLINNGDEILSSPGSRKIIDAIASVYGVDMVDAMVEVKKDDSSKIKVWGYVSQPVISKSDRGGESFFVNGRYVRNMLLSRALEDAYSSLIPGSKYPIAVLFIEIEPKKIDVNVHPAKREIKFERPSDTIAAIKKAVSNALSSITAEEVPSSHDFNIGSMNNSVEADALDMFEGQPSSHERSNVHHAILEDIPEVQAGFTAITQLYDTYIVAVHGDELVLIDQHAAHERILYEKFKIRDVSGSQKLLLNNTIEFSPSDFIVIKDNLEYLNELGFELEVFGKNTYIVRAMSMVLEYNQAKEAIENILSDLVDTLKIKDSLKRKDEVLKMLACRGAIKAGDKLSFEEMNNLIREIFKTEFSTTCPHGRPTIIKFNKNDLEKMFKRK